MGPVLENLPIGTSSENHPIITSSRKSSYWYQSWKIILLVRYKFQKIVLLVPVLENRPIGTSRGKSSYWYQSWKIVLLVPVLEKVLLVPVMEIYSIGTSSGKSSYWYKFQKIMLLVPVLEYHTIGTSSRKSFYWYQFWKIILSQYFIYQIQCFDFQVRVQTMVLKKLKKCFMTVKHRNQDKVSNWGDMSIPGLLFQ